jgi:FkbM family methyltransferase
MTEITRILKGVHEPQEEFAYSKVLEHLKTNLKSNPSELVCVELGSYWAYYSMWFLREFPTARAICIEPDPHNLDLGKRNFALNEMVGEFAQLCISAKDGGLTTFITEKSKEKIQVPQVNLRGIYERFGLNQIDMLLVDIQGAEEVLLAESLSLLRQKKIKFLIISTHEESISGSAITHQQVLDYIQLTGGTILCEHTIYESCSGDGLVVATYDDKSTELNISISRVRAKDSLFGEPELKLEKMRNQIKVLEYKLVNLSDPEGELFQRRQDSEMIRLHSEIEELKAQISAIKSSELWRITKPLRKLMELIRRLRKPSN